MMDRHGADRLGAFVGIALVLMMAFTTVAPFFVGIPQSSVRLIDQQQTILQSVFMVLVGYLWGSSDSSKRKDSAIENQAAAISAAQAALTPAEPAIPVGPGETVTVEGKPE